MSLFVLPERVPLVFYLSIYSGQFSTVLLVYSRYITGVSLAQCRGIGSIISSQCFWVGELLQLGFQDVSFLPSWATFFTTFLINCGGGESLRTTTCLGTVVGGRQGHAPCEECLLQQSHILCQLNCVEIIRLRQYWGKSGHPHFCGYYWIWNIGVCHITVVWLVCSVYPPMSRFAGWGKSGHL